MRCAPSCCAISTWREPTRRGAPASRPATPRISSRSRCRPRSAAASSSRSSASDYPTPDGTCLRDYIQVTDLAQAHMDALRHLRGGGASLTCNVGYARGYSVKEVVDVVRHVSGAEVPAIMSPRRAGDPAAIVASNDRIRAELGWIPETRQPCRDRATGAELGAAAAQRLGWVMPPAVPALATDRLELRPATLADASAIQTAFPHWNVVRFFSAAVPWPFPDDGALSFLRDKVIPEMEAGLSRTWTIRLRSDPVSLIGAIGLYDEPNNNRGFWLHPRGARPRLCERGQRIRDTLLVRGARPACAAHFKSRCQRGIAPYLGAARDVRDRGRGP